jgi:hypothetical protein
MDFQFTAAREPLRNRVSIPGIEGQELCGAAADHALGRVDYLRLNATSRNGADGCTICRDREFRSRRVGRRSAHGNDRGDRQVD